MDYYPTYNYYTAYNNTSAKNQYNHYDKKVNDPGVKYTNVVYPVTTAATVTHSPIVYRPPPQQNPNLNYIIAKSKSHHHVDRMPRTSNYKALNYSNVSSLAMNKYKQNTLKDRVALYTPIRLLRRLGQNERIFHGQNDFSRSYIYRTVIITSDIDLYNNLNVVYAAVDEWKRVNPLLKCRVITKPDYTNNNVYGANKEKFFAFADDSKIKGYDNIKFLYYDSHSSKSCEDLWKLLVEKETTLTLDGENGLLWRLTFFQIKTMTKPGYNSSSHLYAVILTFDHSVMDGRSSYSALLNLFAIIEDMYKTNYNKQREHQILPSKEDIYKAKRQTPLQTQVVSNYIKAPHFLDIENAIKSSYIRLKYLTPEEESFGIIYTHDKKPYVTVRELVEISKTNNSKFRTLVIQKNDLARILKKCKDNNVKLTTFINMCLVLAIRMIYEKNQQNYPKESATINFTTNISLREFPEYLMYNPEKNYVGCYIGLSFSTFRERLYFYNNPNWINEFWRLSKKESDDFHERLAKGEYIHSINLPPKKKEHDEFFYHFGNSNLGSLPSSLDDRRMIKIRQAFATGKYSRENFLCWFSNLIATVDNQLCWTVSYNTFFIKQEFINLIIENLTKVIKELIK